MNYIIDGYNVIHKIAQLKNKRLRSQREALIRLLESARRQNRHLKELTVVFDGQEDVLAPAIDSPVRVVFTRGKSADKKIKELVETASSRRDIGVVSDDRELLFYISSVGAKKIAVDEFLQMVFSSSMEEKEYTFKVDKEAARKINQELAKIWLR